MPLRLRRGTNAERQTITPAQGELIYVTDTKRIWVGDGTTVGGVDIVAAGGGSLQGSINLNSFNIEGLGNIDINGYISNDTLSLNGNAIFSDDSFIAAGSGNTIGTLNLGSETNLLQTIRSWKEPVEPIEIQQGVTNGFFSLVTTKSVVRGTLSSPTPVFAGDCLSVDRVYGYDGFSSVLSSEIWRGVDPLESVGPGAVPGAIALITYGSGGQNVAGFDSNGNFGINKFPSPATEALDVNGNGLFSGSVTAAAFKGSFFADDSTLLVDGITGTLSNGTLTFNNSSVFSNDTFVTSISGNTVGKVNIGSSSNSVQLVRYWKDSYESYEKVFGISDGFTGLPSDKYSSRGTLNSPSAILPGDCITVNIGNGYDGSNYQISSLIWQGVDPNGTVSPGVVPGSIIFYTSGASGLDLTTSSQFTSDGYLGIRNGFTPPTEVLDVYGNIKLAGKVILNQSVAGDPAEEHYGISSGAFSLTSLKYSSAGTLASPTALSPSAAIAAQANYGHDGTSYVLSSVIGFGVDPNGTVSTGAVPGSISFFTAGSSGTLNTSSGFDSQGYLGIRNGATAPTEALDIHGNSITRGTQFIRQVAPGVDNVQKYSITNGLFSAGNSTFTSRGNFTTPTIVQPGDALAMQTNWGYDGSNYILSSFIWCGVDPNDTITPGVVPGSILFFTAGPGGQNISSQIDSNGRFGIRNGALPPRDALDVNGGGIFNGTVTAPGFIGSVYADDSTTVIDSATGNINGNQVSAAAFKGTFVADDSTILVDGISGKIVGDVKNLSVQTDTLKGPVSAPLNIESQNNNIIEIGYQTAAPTDIYIGSTGATVTRFYNKNLLIATSNVPTSSKGQAGDVTYMFAVDNSNLYYCIGNYDGVADIWVKTAWTGGAW